MGNNNYEIGDILFSSRGYNRTDVNFYKVVKMTAKTLTIQPIGSEVVDGDPLRVYHVVADESKLNGNTKKVWINKYGTAVLRGCPNEYFFKWDGKPQWANTGYAF